MPMQGGGMEIFMESFNVKTEFKSNTYYIFDNSRTNIYLSECQKIKEKKYFTITEKNTDRTFELNTAFYLRNLENVTLDFGGAVITLHGKIQPFIIDCCENITIKNVTVAYDRAHYTELDIIRRSGNKLYTKPKEKFPCRVENGYFIAYAPEWEDREIYARGAIFMQAFDKKSREGEGMIAIYLGEEIIRESSPPADYIPHIKVKSDGEEIVFIGEFPDNWNSEHSIVLEHNGRVISGMAIYHSKNILIEDYRILNGGGLGIFSVSTENICIKSFKLINDELSHGIIANSADAIHFVASKGKIEISDSIFEGMIDDALNIHSNYYFVDKAENNVIYARRTDKSSGLNAYSDVFAVGDKIAIYEGMTLKERKQCTVIDREIIEKWVVKLTLDENLSDVEGMDLIENLSTNADITITNSRFSKANTHLRFQSRGKITIENCDFTLPILLTGDTNYWFEASPVTDIEIKNCNFTGNRAKIHVCPEFMPCDEAPYYHSNISIINNRFDVRTPFKARYAKNIMFKNNKISDGSEPMFELYCCENFTSKNGTN